MIKELETCVEALRKSDGYVELDGNMSGAFRHVPEKFKFDNYLFIYYKEFMLLEFRENITVVRSAPYEVDNDYFDVESSFSQTFMEWHHTPNIESLKLNKTIDELDMAFYKHEKEKQHRKGGTFINGFSTKYLIRHNKIICTCGKEFEV